MKKARVVYPATWYVASSRARHATAGISLLCLPALVLGFTARTVRPCRALGQEGASPPASLSTQGRFERGKQLMEQRKFAEAAAEFREILKTEPKSPFLYNLLGFCALQQGSRREAMTEFKRALELDPKFKPARNNLGGIYLLEGRPQDAVNEFLAITRIDPRDAQAYFNLARAELATKQRERGLKHLRTAHELAPTSAPIAMALARLYFEEGQREVGQRIVEKLAYARASDAATELELGNLFLAYGKEDAAAERFRRVQDVDPRGRESLYALAVNHFKKGEYTASLKLLKMVAPSMQNSAALHDLVAENYFKLGDPAPAVAELQKAMELDPRNEDYVLELSEIFVANNTPATAATLLESATKMFPNSARIWFALGVAFLGEGHYSAAETALNKSRELDPKLDLTYVVLCRGYNEAGNWAALTQTAERLIQVNPRNPMAYYYLALARLHNPAAYDRPDEEAQKLLKKSIALNENDPEPRYELAKLMIKGGNKDAALLELQKIIRATPDFSPAHYQLSRFYRERGEIGKSEEERKIFERLSAQEHIKAMTKMLVEIHERRPSP